MWAKETKESTERSTQVEQFNQENKWHSIGL